MGLTFAAPEHEMAVRYRAVQRWFIGDNAATRDNDALAAEAGRLHALRARDQVQRAALVFFAPAPPVTQRRVPLKHLVLGRNLSLHRPLSFPLDASPAGRVRLMCVCLRSRISRSKRAWTPGACRGVTESPWRELQCIGVTGRG